VHSVAKPSGPAFCDSSPPSTLHRAAMRSATRPSATSDTSRTVTSVNPRYKGRSATNEPPSPTSITESVGLDTGCIQELQGDHGFSL